VGGRYQNHSLFGAYFVPKAGLVVRVAEHLVLRAGHGHGFRAPDLGQFYYRFANPASFYQVIGNPTLQPETSRSYSAGGVYTRSRFRLGLNLYRNDVKDLIESLLVGTLRTAGVREIVAIPLFVSSHSPVITATQYLLGLRAEAPPELARFARTSHDHGSHSTHHSGEATFDPTTPVTSPVPIRTTAALDKDPMVADILLSRAQSISRDPGREVVIVVAHGPVSDEENARWLADMGILVERMQSASAFRRIEYLTVRDDAPEPVRSRATAELRAVVERAIGQGHSVLLVALLMAYGGIEKVFSSGSQG